MKSTKRIGEKHRGANGRFLPGNPGGPGRPKGDVLRHISAIAELESTQTGKTMGEAVAWKLYELAIKDGDIHAIRELLNRLHGKAKQPLEHELASEIKIRVVYEDFDDGGD